MKCKFKTINTLFAMMLFACLMLFANDGVYAKTSTVKKETTYSIMTVGQTMDLSGTSVKINKKSLNKSNAKYDVSKYSTNTSSYITGKWFVNSSAYANYYAAMQAQTQYKYYKTSSYQVLFKKPGTYTVSETSYSTNSYTRSDSYYVKGVYYYKFYKYDNKTGNILYFNGSSFSQKDSSKAVGFVQKQTPTEETYYQYGKTIIAQCKSDYGYSYYGDGSFVKASLEKGVDGKIHVKVNAPETVKVEYTRKIKVVDKNSYVLSSISLGKSKKTYSSKFGVTSKTATTTSKDFLSGKKGKLSVKSSSNYAIQSIIVKTYDKDGNAVYKQVKNKKVIAYGTNAGYLGYNYYSTSEQNRTLKTLFKPTTVFISYKNKHDKSSTKMTLTTINGSQTIKVYNTEYEKAYKQNNPGKKFVCNYWGCKDSKYHTHTSDPEYSGNVVSETFYLK